MDLTPLLLSRLQFAFTISYHIIFPSFTIGLAAWLTLLEALNWKTGRMIYRRLFDFWLRIFGVAFGLGVVSGIVMAFEFGTNWSQLSTVSGPIQGPLLAYESFTAFALEASFFGVLIFGRSRVSPKMFLLSTAMVALGTTLSAFWIMVNNSWMQAPVGYEVRSGIFEPTDWATIIFNPVVWVRFPHMLVAAYLTGAFCVAATGAWYRLNNISPAESRTMLGMGLMLASVLIPVQLTLGHFNGDYVHKLQPTKFAAIEARWHSEQPAGEVLIALPDSSNERNRFELKVPVLGSLIASGSLTSKEIGLTNFPKAEWPPVTIPFFSFRIMVGCGLLMTAIAWIGLLMMRAGRLERNPVLLRAILWSFPLPFIATLTGWFTAEVGRQPWTIFGLLRTADAVTPNLTQAQTMLSLALFVAVHSLVFGFGTFYIHRLLKHGLIDTALTSITNPKRPLALVGQSPSPPMNTVYRPGNLP